MVDSRAQSETIGTLLITGIVILSTVTVGVGLLASYEHQVSAEPPPADFRTELNATSLTLTHVGGEDFPLAKLDLVLRNETAEQRYDLDSLNESQPDLDGDALFEGGESVTVNASHSQSGRIRILLIETADGGAVLYDEYKSVTGE